MSSDQHPLQVVVIDDVSRFACHVFQYLSGNIGFGIGRVPDDGGERNPPFERCEALPTPAGDAAVWWVDAATDWNDQLERVLARIENEPASFLVDVRGPLRASNNYHVEAVVSRLLEKGRKSKEIVPVSSYRTGSLMIGRENKEIRPKTWKVLQAIAEQLSKRRQDLAGFHILVTGAGFELESRRGGCQGLGMPSTSSILEEGWKRFGESELEKSQGFPVPLGLGDCSALRRKARDGNLDAYWNEALELILADPGRDKLSRSRREYMAREAFRHALLRYDWGQLNQALDAASLGWVAWLSTNYTGFADRALALTERERKRSSTGAASDFNPWSIVSTSHEAVHLTRRLLHGWVPTGRTLFKLHGHIEHLLTMAIAGQDKEIYSTLSLPVDSLHEVYSAAELYLKRCLDGKKVPVYWHVVGHRLKDALLESILLGVAKATQAAAQTEHIFLFVRPGKAREIEKDHHDCFSNWTIKGIDCRADEYMARLRRWGMTAMIESI